MSLENKIVDYAANVKEIEHWTTLKGVYRYEAIIAFMESKNIDCTWKNVTSYIKYDKRILINLFKYIVFLEEMYKSFVFSKYKQRVKKMGFQQAYYEFLNAGNNTAYDGIDFEVMKEVENTINELRNKVAHNNILLNQKIDKLSLEETLNKFVYILPNSYRNGFIKDINDCSKNLVDNNWHIEL